MKSSDQIQWEIKKFEKEISALKNMNEQSAPALNQAAAQGLKQKLLGSIAGSESQTRPAQEPIPNSHKLIRYVISLLLGLSLAGGTSFASELSVPGDLLYGVKRFKEQVQLKITPSGENRAHLQAKLAEERLDELEQITAKGPETSANAKSVPTSTSAASASGNAEAKKHDRLKIQAKQEAGLAVSQALESLEGIRNKGREEDKGEKPKDSLDKEISQLKIRAKIQGLNLQK